MSNLDEEAMLWLARQESGRITPSDLATFTSWHNQSLRHQGAYLRAKAIWHTLDQANVLSDIVPDAKSESVLHTLPLTTKYQGAKGGIDRRVWLMSGFAAAIGAALFFKTSDQAEAILTTRQGEFRRIPLQDTSVANLNTDSEIEVKMSKSLRRIDLRKGEAWFEVAKNPDRPFVVEAGGIRVRAVGTAFSVRRREGGSDVLVTEGVVDAWSDQNIGGRKRLKAGESAFIDDIPKPILVSKAPEKVERKLAWREGNIILDNDSLTEAVLEFNRYNSKTLTIADPDLANIELVGIYRLNEPEGFARDVQALLKVPVSVTNTDIIIGTSRDQSF
jgi:transmembrane sensor